MTSPRRTGSTRIGNIGTGTTDPGTVEPPDVPPLDPEEIRQRHLLAEAVLVSFTATPTQLAPFGRSTLAWDITMPTTVLPGVHVEVHLAGAGDQVVDPKGTRAVAPYTDTTYALYLRAPLASRHLGNVDLVVDLGACTLVNTAPGAFSALAKGEADKPFPPGGQMKFRGNGSSVDIGYNSYVVDMPLKPSVPNWFDPDVDVTMGFSVSSENGEVRVDHDVAITKVSFGVLSSILSLSCSAHIATAVELTSDGFLSGFVGPVVADRIERAVQINVNTNLTRLNTTVPRPPIPYRFYDLTLTAAEGLTYRFCPARSGSQEPTHPLDGGGGDHPIHP
jgi:hypothetical protein